MNMLNKLRNLFKKNKIIAYTFKKAIATNKNSLLFGTSLFGLGYLGYNNINQNFLPCFRKASCFQNKRNPLNSKSNILVYTSVEDPVRDKSIDDVNYVEVPKESKSEPLVFEHNLPDEAVNGLPTEVPYIIIGGGIAGMSAARAIRASDPFAKVLIINSECHSPGQHKSSYPPYRRILLSKFIWRRSEEKKQALLNPLGDVRSTSFLFIEPESFFVAPERLNQLEYGGISLLNNTKVVSIDPRDSSITLEGSGHKITFKACLIASGSYPRRLMNLEVSDNTGVDLYQTGRVSYFRSLNDYRNLSEYIKQLQASDKGGRLMIVGSGLLGTELTSSLGRLARDQGKLEVIEVFREKSHLYHLLPAELSQYIYRNIASKETKLMPQSEVVSIGEIKQGPDSGRLKINIRSLCPTGNNEPVYENVDHVVIAAGVMPDTSLSMTGNLETDPVLGGFLVNAELQARDGIFIAGDACSFHDPVLGRRRVEHWNHSEESGTIAGHNMASYVLKSDKHGLLDRIDRSKLANDILKPKIYNFQSSFSFKLTMFKTIEALGLIDSSLETMAFIASDFYEDPTEEEQEEWTTSGRDALDMPGVVFYLRNKRVVGVLLWNCDDDLVVDSDAPSPLRSNLARKILADRTLVPADDDLKCLAADFDLSFFINSQVKSLSLNDDNSKPRDSQTN